MKSVDRDNEVVRILQAFKLNPFEQLGITFDATAGDIRKAYRKLSLLVHPGASPPPSMHVPLEVSCLAICDYPSNRIVCFKYTDACTHIMVSRCRQVFT